MLFILTGLVLVISTGIQNFKFDASSDTLVLENDIYFEQYEKTNEKFGESEFLVVAIDNRKGKFDKDFLEKLQNLQIQLSSLNEVNVPYRY